MLIEIYDWASAVPVAVAAVVIAVLVTRQKRAK